MIGIFIENVCYVYILASRFQIKKVKSNVDYYKKKYMNIKNKINKKKTTLKVGNAQKQELAQLERNCHSQTEMGKTRLTIRYLNFSNV